MQEITANAVVRHRRIGARRLMASQQCAARGDRRETC
jgi:hypothetical protein